MNTLSLVKKLKDNDQDYDWYPTTKEILDCADRHAQKTFGLYGNEKETLLDVLDIGAGDARAAKQLSHGGTKKVIEISQILTNKMSADCIPVGTDFMQANIMPIESTIIFSNPPYRASGGFKEWAKKIITEGNAQGIYLVVPERWKNDKEIQLAIEERKARAEVIGEFNFLDAERKARGTVNVVFICLCAYDEETQEIVRMARGTQQNVDPFDTWINKTFQFSAPDNRYSSGMNANKKDCDFNQKLDNQLVSGKNQVEALVNMYNHELMDFKSLYDAIAKIPYEQLKALGASVDSLKKSIKENLAGMKNKYWQELFNRYSPITDKLTKMSRRDMLSKLNKQVGIDFSLPNIYAVTAWCCKNANEYFDSQLIDVYERLTREANIQLYKSNKKVFSEEDWRYRRKPEHIGKYCLKLDYRMVISGYGQLSNGYYAENGLEKLSHELLNDLSTIAQNLGFPKTQKSESFKWDGSLINFTWPDDTIFMQARAHKNGNLHLKVNIDAMKAINIKFSKLMGWIKEPKEAAEEMNMSYEDAKKYFEMSHSILPERGILKICA